MKIKPARIPVESKPIVVVDMRERVGGLSDGELDTLHANAMRLAQNGSERQRASADALIPAIEAELTTRRAKELAASPRARRNAARVIEPAAVAAVSPAISPEVASPERKTRAPAHKFALGATVKLCRTLMGLPVDGLIYEVVRQLPAERSEFQYRVRTKDGRVERIVLESQVSGA
ncbi:MAG: hypothetical protein GC190_09945 [Alphaproteobacteria bacterium]|nr:hypothetical protein [Alphaproteobacteria bacterium]